jgi:hypothetical protein
MNTLRILIKSKNFGSIHDSLINKNNFIQFNKDYCHNLTRYNYKIKNLNVFDDTENSNFISEVELDISAEKFLGGYHGENILTKLKQDDLFYLFRKKYYQHNLYLKVNYLKPYDIPKNITDTQDIFLL